ncbi:hypothetical protein WBN73_10325 [Paenarthrobacter sp. CCNWLY172]|uniref:DUF2795 domain-containing protein n=1 Tax=Paenarthrobacter sp. AMU7 TaxID=3162492 RepID=A0AB39YR07_9MICC|nr:MULTISPECIES: hypothetical protein [Micrococcaceae]QSZ50708.1 hypothetical protein AYX22_21465 [Arthrobacter sp. D5-1]WGM20415.1 hypothetical protein QEH68_20765 [Paenarthrobacter sp. OM7]
MEIFMWWLDLHLDSKEWLRENLRADELPLPVLQHIAEAGGPHPDKVSGVLTDADWDFIETQSEFVD